MRWNNYDLNVYVNEGVVSITAYELQWSGNIAFNNLPEYETYAECDSLLNLNFENPEHKDAIAYALDREYWEEDSWQGYDEWSQASEWLRVPEPIKSWLQALPAYDVILTPEIEANLISHGMLDDDASSILEWI